MATAFMKQALGILRDAEVRLCELIPKALAGRRDEEAGQLMELARMLADARSLRAGSGPAQKSEVSSSAGADTSQRAPAARKRKARKRKASPYPKFLREGDALLKLGWSRKSGAEYEHRAPCQAVLAVAARVAEVASARSRFTIDDLGDIRVARREGPISSCQLYLCIAWFRRAGLVVQHGRRGYSLPTAPAKLAARVRSAWGTLKEC